MPDKMISVGGSVLMLCNTSDDSAIVLSWRSKILKRKVTSSLAGECYALNSCNIRPNTTQRRSVEKVTIND